MRNYTSMVPPEKSLANIERMLVKFGAIGITKTYANGAVSAITFELKVGTAQVVFQLPCQVDRVYDYLKKHARTQLQIKRAKEQAPRTAWKVLAEWVEIQLDLITLGQAKPAEVFLPYVFDGRQTFFDQLEATGFQSLLALPAVQGGE